MFSIEIAKTKHEGVAIATLCKNGVAISPENPAVEKEELAEFYEALWLSGNDHAGVTCLVVSGMPLSFVTTACLFFKNLYKAIAVNNPRFGGCFIVSSTTKEYEVGDFIDLR